MVKSRRIVSQIQGGLAFQIADAHQVGCPDHVAAERQRDAAEQEQNAAAEGVAEQLPEKKRHHHRAWNERMPLHASSTPTIPDPVWITTPWRMAGVPSTIGGPGAQRRVEVRELGNQGRLDACRPRHRNQEKEQREGKMMDPASAADQVKRAEGDSDDGSGKRPSGKTPVRDHLQEQAARQRASAPTRTHTINGPVEASRGSGAGRCVPALPEQTQAEQGHEPAISVILAAIPKRAQPVNGIRPEDHQDTCRQPAKSRARQARCARGYWVRAIPMAEPWWTVLSYVLVRSLQNGCQANPQRNRQSNKKGGFSLSRPFEIPGSRGSGKFHFAPEPGIPPDIHQTQQTNTRHAKRGHFRHRREFKRVACGSGCGSAPHSSTRRG